MMIMQVHDEFSSFLEHSFCTSKQQASKNRNEILQQDSKITK